MLHLILKDLGMFNIPIRCNINLSSCMILMLYVR